MLTTVRKLDRILRGEATSLEAIRENRFDIPVIGISFLLTILGMIYGLCMGVFSLTASGSNQHMQIFATTVKVPALFLLTLVVTFPSLYVFNTIFGSRLGLVTMLRLMIGALAVTLAVLSSIGPIVAFFSVSSASYAFMVILNVAVFALSGFLGLGFLLQTLHRLTIADQPAPPPAPAPVIETTVYADSELSVPVPPPLNVGSLGRPDERRVSAGVWLIFRTWVVVFGLVGAQMAWVLRPFIGSPSKEFTWFRPVGGNFFEAVWMQLGRLLGW